MATWRTPKACACSSTPLAWTSRSPVSSQGAPKQSLVLQDRREGLVAIGLPSGERGEAGDNPALDLREHDLTAELHRGSALVPRDEAGVRLKQTQHFLASGDLPTVQHAGPRLRDNALDEGKEVVDLGLKPPCTPGDWLERATALLPRRRQRDAHTHYLLHRLLCGLQERLLQRALERGFGGCRQRPSSQAMQPLRRAAHRTQPGTEGVAHAREWRGDQRFGLAQESREQAHPVDQQPTVGRLG